MTNAIHIPGLDYNNMNIFKHELDKTTTQLSLC